MRGFLARSVQGQKYKWQLSDYPVGSGDAGEVYAVICIEQPDLHGVLKTPARIATTGTIQRQAGQIAQERRALAQLDGLRRGKVHPPRLLDEAQAYTQGTANYFIISETAPGENFASMLAQSRQMGKPFPQRVTITVLDAIFDLFARAHRVGVLWNDVKLDHIYWHNPTGEITVIDWGNALFLDDETNNRQRTPPRWQDYRQLVDSLGGFLKHSSPELYDDLGWGEFQGEELDSPRVSILARRVAYQQQVLALKEMEYQALIRVILISEPTFESLQKIQGYILLLDQIGAPWPHDEILRFGQDLVETALTKVDTNEAVKGAALVWEIFDESLDLSWYLAREYLRHPDILSHTSLADLVKFTLINNWSLVLWTLVTIAHEIGNPKWWSKTIPVIRQNSLGKVSPRPIQMTQSLLAWVKTHHVEKKETISFLTASLENWRAKGENLSESPFDYAVLDLDLGEINLSQDLRYEIKRSFAAGEEAIRELIKGWVNMTWDEMPKAFHLLLCWDPDRWGILALQESVWDFQDWLKRLYMGPNSEEDAFEFLKNTIRRRPTVDRILGRPTWFLRLMTMITAIQSGAAISDYHALVQYWCPWLLKFTTIHTSNTHSAAIEIYSDQQVILQFIEKLKGWNDIEVGLQDVKERAPAYHPYCLNLVAGFNNVLALNFDFMNYETQFKETPLDVLNESCKALQELINWRKKIDQNDLETAFHELDAGLLVNWEILRQAKDLSRKWHDTTLPSLQGMHNFSTSPKIHPWGQLPENWAGVLTGVKEIGQTWTQVYEIGIQATTLETLEQDIESSRLEFYHWRQSQEHAGDPIIRLLYHHHLDLVHQISKQWLRLSQHSRHTRLSFAELNGNEMYPSSNQIKNIENLLYHLGKMEAILIKTVDERSIPGWQAAFKEMLDTTNPEDRRQRVLSLPKDDPFYRWLVQLTFLPG